MKFAKIFLILFAVSLATSCSPEAIGDHNSTTIDGPQATNDNDIIIDDGSKR